MSLVVRPTRHSIICEAALNKKADSAAKRARQAEKRRVYNKARKSEVKTRMKKYIPGRTDVQCLHRWQKVLNPELVKGPWTKEEDDCIIGLVEKYGCKKWSAIAKFLPGRIGKQCREREGCDRGGVTEVQKFVRLKSLERVLVKILGEYELDGIDWTKVDFEDNQECLDLFEKKPIGLISLLDEDSNFPKATDLTFANKLKKHLSGNPCFKGERGGAFGICHYAGEVFGVFRKKGTKLYEASLKDEKPLDQWLHC
ncbi:unnamed protein product [Camellia sinensis]